MACKAATSTEGDADCGVTARKNVRAFAHRQYEGELSEFGKKFHYGTRSTGGMTHNDPDNRPADVFGGNVTLHAGGGREAYLLLPIIPAKGS